MSSLRRESDVASISQVCALRLFWGFFRRWVTVRSTTREEGNQLEVTDYGRVNQVNSQSSFRDSLRRFAGGTFWMVVEGLDQDGQGLGRAREEAERASVFLLSGLWDIHVDVPTPRADYCVCTLMEVEIMAWIAVSVSGWLLSSQVGF